MALEPPISLRRLQDPQVVWPTMAPHLEPGTPLTPWYLEPQDPDADFPNLGPCFTKADVLTRLQDHRLVAWIKENPHGILVVSKRPLLCRWLCGPLESGAWRELWFKPGQGPWTGTPMAWAPWTAPGIPEIPGNPELPGTLYYFCIPQESSEISPLTPCGQGPREREAQESTGLRVEVLRGGLVSNARLSPLGKWISPVKAGEDALKGTILLVNPLVEHENTHEALAWFQGIMNGTRLDGIATLSGAQLIPQLSDLGQLLVLHPGLMVQVVQYPGRVGYWDVGIPPSGPADPLHAVKANRALGNSDDAPILEITMTGFSFTCTKPTTLALSGATAELEIKKGYLRTKQTIGSSQSHVFEVQTDEVVTISLGLRGARTYLAIPQGFSVGSYLGSSTTFTLGGLGGWGGRPLEKGDHIPFGLSPEGPGGPRYPYPDDPGEIPPGGAWTIELATGPQASIEFFAPGWLETLYDSTWTVHHNSDRTGIRLLGPRPRWARSDGGEAGLHPSNIHDNAYVVGSLDFTGDMPIILGPDGPSLGGFACPGVVSTKDLWKLGQLRPGNTIQFTHNPTLTNHTPRVAQNPRDLSLARGILPEGTPWRILPSGDRAMLIELGEAVLDLGVRLLIHRLWLSLKARGHEWISELCPGIRSLQVQWSQKAPSLATMVGLVASHLEDLGSKAPEPLSSRTVWLPLSWDDPATQKAISLYQTSVRADAPWCPDNIEFIRRINGLETKDQVKTVVHEAEYLVMGLGDVYLGAPVATPLDPRHRLVTTKYNPARTWTPENAVGIGGAYLCIYGMEGPGGYQFVGRTIQMWNRRPPSPTWPEPYLLRFFDRIRFYPVGHEELMDIREDFPRGRYEVKIQEGSFDYAHHQGLLRDNQEAIAQHIQRQTIAYQEERSRWAQKGY